MAQLSVPSAPKEYSTQYRVLLGVDFRADQTEVDRRRSPDMVNMISDFGGNPVKRDGYRRVCSPPRHLVEIDGVTYGIYATSSATAIYAETMLGYEMLDTTVGTYSGNIGTIRNAFTYQRKIYIVGTYCLLSFDVDKQTFSKAGVKSGQMSTNTIGESAPANTDNIPLTVIDLKPDGTNGTALEDKNIFSIYQTVSYKGDGASDTFTIPNYTKIGTYVKAEVYDYNDQAWEEVIVTTGTVGHDNSWRIDGTNNLDYCSIVDPTVTLAVTPPVPLIAGEDNVRITFAPYSMEQLERFGNPTPQSRGYYNEHLVGLLECNAATIQSNRMFIAEKYRVYWSKLSDPFYISDLSWFDVNSEIVGFSRSNNNLLVLAKDTGTSTIYLAAEQMRTVDSTTGETETYFTVKESNSGIGAIAPKCIGTLIDEPMFLSNTGVYGILTNYLSDKYAVNRSARIDRKLCQEPNLENAVGIAFNDYFYIAVNGRMYVLDGRHKESDRAGNKPLEAYYFEGLPAIENMFVVGGRMFFTDNTKTYTWNDDLPETERYYDCDALAECISVLYGISDSYTKPPTGTNWTHEEPTPAAGEVLWFMGAFDDLKVVQSTNRIEVGDKKMSGDPVCARWCSVYDDDGVPQRLKTLMKKGSMVTLVPHFKSGCEITLVKDGDVFEYLGAFNSDINSFDSIDFNSFSFSSNQVAVDNFTKKKVKKYKRLQIQIENNNAEPFGLTQVTKTYTFGNYAKR